MWLYSLGKWNMPRETDHSSVEDFLREENLSSWQHLHIVLQSEHFIRNR